MSISITRALTEIKTLQERIGVAISNSRFIAVTKGQGDRKTVVGVAKAPAQIEQEILVADQKVRDLIVRRVALKRAVIHSNHITKVVIAGEVMTVAEAIDRKQSVLLEKQYLDNLRAQFNQANNGVIQLNTKLNEEIERAVQNAYGNEKGKVSEEQYNAVAAPRRKEHEAALLDPLNASDKIEKLNERISNFLMEVDFVLSESNARTEIDVG